MSAATASGWSSFSASPGDLNEADVLGAGPLMASSQPAIPGMATSRIIALRRVCGYLRK